MTFLILYYNIKNQVIIAPAKNIGGMIMKLFVRIISSILGFFPLENLESVFKVLAGKLNVHRESNNGWVPREVFTSVLAIAGKDFCIEIVVYLKGRGVFLKKRNQSGEQGWKDQYQIPGVSRLRKETVEETLDRLSMEIFGEQGKLSLDNLDDYGFEVHSELERGEIDCTTQLFVFTFNGIEPENVLKQLFGEWKFFAFNFVGSINFEDTSSVIKHHKETLDLILNLSARDTYGWRSNRYKGLKRNIILEEVGSKKEFSLCLRRHPDSSGDFIKGRNFVRDVLTKEEMSILYLERKDGGFHGVSDESIQAFADHMEINIRVSEFDPQTQMPKNEGRLIKRTKG